MTSRSSSSSANRVLEHVPGVSLLTPRASSLALWLATQNVLRPFDGAVPDLSALSFDADLTRRLAARARAEQTTVNSALVQPRPR
jgi:hypothetical protein